MSTDNKITRRDALKRIIFYFTGTGNCLYIARYRNEHISLMDLKRANNQKL